MAHRPVGVGTSVAITAGTATTTLSFGVQSNSIRVVTTSNAYVAVGATPSATRLDYYVPSNTPVTLALSKASDRVTNVITGATTRIDVPEGNHSSFTAGDYVSLTTSGVSTNQSYYDFEDREVLSVDTSANVDGSFSRRITVNHSTSGILTAFASPHSTLRLSNKVSVFGLDAGTLYAQQVQVSGVA